jgi:hypothetical protein
MATKRRKAATKPAFVISCHADTGFRRHRLAKARDGRVYGHLDNFAGVHAVMKAYFSGKLDYDHVRIELTEGEEIDCAGARRVLRTLRKRDVVAVVDVTGARTKADITIEKCADPWTRAFVEKALTGLAFDLYEGCPDPVADEDESDVYREKLTRVFFLGIPCQGGDYNAKRVYCRERSIAAASRALARLAAAARSIAAD